uniref:hypothetical protein n=1 Tax=Nocardia suismassiliense TaxID=2077092 RepID=UPI003F496F6F
MTNPNAPKSVAAAKKKARKPKMVKPKTAGQIRTASMAPEKKSLGAAAAADTATARAAAEFSPTKLWVIFTLILVLGLVISSYIFIGVLLLTHTVEAQVAIWVVTAVLGAVGALALGFFVKVSGRKPLYGLRLALAVAIHPDRRSLLTTSATENHS